MRSVTTVLTRNYTEHQPAPACVCTVPTSHTNIFIFRHNCIRYPLIFCPAKKQISCPVSVSRKQSFKFEQSLVRANFPRRLPVLCHKWKCPTPTLTSPVNLQWTHWSDGSPLSCGPDRTLPRHRISSIRISFIQDIFPS